MATYVAFCDYVRTVRVCASVHHSKDYAFINCVFFLSQVYAYRTLQPAANRDRDKRRFFKGKDEIFDKATFNKENICTNQNETLMK
jgi:hypothetical protein